MTDLVSSKVSADSVTAEVLTLKMKNEKRKSKKVAFMLPFYLPYSV